MSLGDARSGKLADNVTGFGRALRRAGVKVDSSRIALAKAHRLLLLIGAPQKVFHEMTRNRICRPGERKH